MANTSLVKMIKVLILLTTFVLSLNTFAKPTRSKGSNMAVGLSSDTSLLRTTNTAASMIYLAGGKKYYQASLAITGSDPLTYSLGGYYKFILKGNIKNGVHLGGGFGLGNFAADSSFWRLAGNAGVHMLIMKRLFLSMDANLAIGKDSANNVSASTLTFGGNSFLFGLSLHYFL